MSSEIANSALLQDIKAVLERARAQVTQTVKKPLINSTVAANCCVMRCSECSHILKYAVLPVLLLLALHPPQRAERLETVRP